MNEKSKCVQFLFDNGWERDAPNDEYVHLAYPNSGRISIDVNEKEIVFINDNGDFLHLPCNIYALIGGLLHFRQLPVNYNQAVFRESKVNHRRPPEIKWPRGTLPTIKW